MKKKRSAKETDGVENTQIRQISFHFFVLVNNCVGYVNEVAAWKFNSPK